MAEVRYVVCSQTRCKNPVPVGLEHRHCGKHGGETVPIWAVYHDEHGWLTDTGVGGSYSFDVDDAMWFFSTGEAVASLVACDLAEIRAQVVRTERTCRVEQFVIVLVK